MICAEADGAKGVEEDPSRRSKKSQLLDGGKTWKDADRNECLRANMNVYSILFGQPFLSPPRPKLFNMSLWHLITWRRLGIQPTPAWSPPKLATRTCFNLHKILCGQRRLQSWFLLSAGRLWTMNDSEIQTLEVLSPWQRKISAELMSPHRFGEK